jgi:hypothetical protein
MLRHRTTSTVAVARVHREVVVSLILRHLAVALLDGWILVGPDLGDNTR